MEKNDLEMLRAENDRLMGELDKLKQRMREEINRTQSSIRLDLNLEKNRLRDETGQQESKIREVETRIETDIAALRTAIQTSKVLISLWYGVVLNGSFGQATTLQYLVTFGASLGVGRVLGLTFIPF